MCQYGLLEPEGSEEEYWKKGLVIVATYPEITEMDRRCSRNEQGEPTGVQGVHSHIHVRKNVRTADGWKARSKLSAAYPKQLCDEWAVLITRTCLRPPNTA